jgi:hypothetical protein
MAWTSTQHCTDLLIEIIRAAKVVGKDVGSEENLCSTADIDTEDDAVEGMMLAGESLLNSKTVTTKSAITTNTRLSHSPYGSAVSVELMEGDFEIQTFSKGYEY